jgi:hypothetical protein
MNSGLTEVFWVWQRFPRGELMHTLITMNDIESTRRRLVIFCPLFLTMITLWVTLFQHRHPSKTTEVRGTLLCLHLCVV